MRKILTDLRYTLVQFGRSRQALFFAFVFPLLFLVLAWYLFGSQAPVTLYYLDGDGTAESQAFLKALGSAGLSIADGSGQDLPQMLRDGRISAYLEIPKGFAGSLAEARAGNGTAGLKLSYDRSGTAASAIVSRVSLAVDSLNYVEGLNAGPLEEAAIVTLKQHELASGSTSYLEYLLPGIVGIAIMGSALDLTVGFIASYRATGVLRKLAVTPLSRLEWGLARVASGVLVALASALVTSVIAWVVFGAHPALSLLALLLAITGAVLFVGLGMVIANFVRDPDAASAASFTITLPLILVSGSLFPATQLPGFLQAIATISPLTYLNDGLRNAMVAGNTGEAVVDLAIIAAVGILLLGAGVASSRWRDN